MVCILFLSRRNDLEIQGKLIAKRKKWIVIGALSWIGALGYAVCLSEKTGVLYSASFNYSSLFMLLFLLGLFALFLPYQKRNNLVDAFIASIGKNTFGIYLSHCIFIFTLQRFWTYSGFVERLIAFCIVFASSYVFTVIINRIPGLCKIVQI
ncbi:acyltransferase family protein [Blautia sp. MCC289]|nr:acyltransferase family protein [Blautia sp. MCC289]